MRLSLVGASVCLCVCCAVLCCGGISNISITGEPAASFISSGPSLDRFLLFVTETFGFPLIFPQHRKLTETIELEQNEAVRINEQEEEVNVEETHGKK